MGRVCELVTFLTVSRAGIGIFNELCAVPKSLNERSVSYALDALEVVIVDDAFVAGGIVGLAIIPGEVEAADIFIRVEEIAGFAGLALRLIGVRVNETLTAFRDSSTADLGAVDLAVLDDEPVLVEVPDRDLSAEVRGSRVNLCAELLSRVSFPVEFRSLFVPVVHHLIRSRVIVLAQELELEWVLMSPDSEIEGLVIGGVSELDILDLPLGIFRYLLSLEFWSFH